jgi:hypothetical protein
VQFAVGGVNRGAPVALSGGTATLAASNLAVGNSAVTGTFIPSGSFSASSATLSGGQTITAAVVSVNANAASKTYGGSDPTLSSTLSGFVNGESASSAGVTGSASCSRTAGQSVGSSPYTITCAPGSLAAANYTFQTGSTASFTINRAQLTIAAGGASKTYGASDPSLTSTLSSFVNGENATSAGVTGAASCSRAAGESVGGSPYTITCTAGSLAAPNYSFTSGGTGHFTITRAQLAVNALSASKTYGSTDPVLGSTLTGFVAGENSTTAGVTGSASCSRTAGQSVGGSPYAVTCTPGTLAAPNYSFVTGSGGVLTIIPAQLSVNALPASKTYGGADPALTSTLLGFVNGENATSAGVTGAASCSRTAGQSVGGSPYLITCTAGSLAAANYTFKTGSSASFTIAPAQLSVDAVAAGKTYGDADPALTSKLTGFVNGEDASSAGVTGSAACSRTAGQSVAGSPYTVTCAAGTLAAPNYVFHTGSTAAFTIAPAQLSVDALSATKTYGDADPALASKQTGFVNGENAVSAAVTGAAACSRAAGESVAGSPYAVTCDPGSLAAPNYVFHTGSTALFTIAPAQLSVDAVAAGKTYGDTDPALASQLSGFVNGEDASSAGVTGSAACSRTAGQSVAGSPYAVTCDPGSLAAPNYVFHTGSTALFTIAPAQLSVDAVAAGKTYGDTDPALTSKLTGYVNGENASSANVTGSAVCSRAAGQSVGGSPYAITCAPGSLAAPNYVFQTGSTASFAIAPAQLSVDAIASGKTYGGADPSLAAKLTGFVNGEDASLAGVTGSAACSRATGESVGGSPYAITCAPGSLAAPNYVFQTGRSAAFAIAPAALTVTADAQKKVYGSPNPTLTATISGFARGDTLATSDVTGAPACSTSASAASGVGGSPYTITCALGSLASTNYTFDFVTGKLTVTQKTLTVTADNKSKSFGSQNPALSDTITGFVLGQTLATSDVAGAAACTTSATLTSPGGTYPITCAVGSLTSVDYAFTFVPGTLTIAFGQTVSGSSSGPLNVGPGQSVVIGSGASVTGPITISAGGSLEVVGGSITGPIRITSPGAVRLCGATIAGPLSISADASSIVIGDGTPGCAANTITGPVTLTNDTGGITMIGNTVDGPLSISGSSGGIVVTGNTITGPLKLSGNTGSVVSSPNSH